MGVRRTGGTVGRANRMLRRRVRTIAALAVLTAAATGLGTAFAARSTGTARTATTPASSFSGTGSSGGAPSSSFSGSGTVSGSGGGEGGGGGDDSGSFGQQGGDGGGSLFLPSSGPGGALSGMSVAAVRQLQNDLARLGYFHHAVTGYYGAITTAAVRRFQRSAGLTPDGLWGRKSAAALTKRLAG